MGKKVADLGYYFIQYLRNYICARVVSDYIWQVDSGGAKNVYVKLS